MHCTAPLWLNARSYDQTEVLPHSLSVTGSITTASVRTDGTAVNVHTWGYMCRDHCWRGFETVNSASEVGDIRPARSQGRYGAEI